MVASLVCLSVRLRVCFLRRPYWCPAALALSHPWHSATIGSVASPFGVFWRSAPLAHSPQYSVIYGAQPLSRSRGVAPVSHSGALGGLLLLLASCCARLVRRSEPFSVLLPSSALFIALAFRPSALTFPALSAFPHPANFWCSSPWQLAAPALGHSSVWPLWRYGSWLSAASSVQGHWPVPSAFGCSALFCSGSLPLQHSVVWHSSALLHWPSLVLVLVLTDAQLLRHSVPPTLRHSGVRLLPLSASLLVLRSGHGTRLPQLSAALAQEYFRRSAAQAHGHSSARFLRCLASPLLRHSGARRSASSRIAPIFGRSSPRLLRSSATPLFGRSSRRPLWCSATPPLWRPDAWHSALSLCR